MPFLENVTRGRRIPRERLAEVAEHYDAFGGVSPINQQCRDLLAAIEEGLRGHRAEPAGLLGQPELASDARRHRRRDGRGRSPARPRVRHLRLRVVLQLPAVPGRYRAGPRPGGRRRPADRQDPALLQPPGVHRAAGRQHARRDRAAAAGGPGRRPPRLHRAQHPRGDGRGQRAAGRPPAAWAVRHPAHRGGAAGRGARGRAPVAPGLSEPQRAARPALARPGRAGPPGRAGRGRRARGRACPGRFRLRPHGGPARPGRGGGRNGGAARPAAAAGGHARHRPQVRLHDHRTGARSGWTASRRSRSAASARRRCLPRGLLPAPAPASA